MGKENTILFIIIALFLGWSSCKTTLPQKTKAPEFGSVYNLKVPLSKPLVSGHRGAKEYPNYPENCLETFQHLRSKIDCIIECDIAQTKDGVLVLMHDRSIDRTTAGTGKVTDLNYSDLKGLHLKDFAGNLTSYKIPKFSAVLKWAATSNTILSVDIKRSAKVGDIVNEIRKYGAASNSMMISYTPEMSQQIYTLAPELMQSVSIRNNEELARWEKNKIPPADKTIAFTGTRKSSKDLYDAIHKHGIPCIFGTLGNIDNQAKTKGMEIYKELLEMGVDIIATDRPLEVAAILEEK